MGKNNKRKTNKGDRSTPNKVKQKALEETFENLKFEDPYEDEFEEEDIINENEINSKKVDVEEEAAVKPWTPSDGLKQGEVLEVDESAYKMLHNVGLEWPSLSFDFVIDELGTGRTRFPHSLTCVVGSQAEDGERNSLKVIKMESLGRVTRTNDFEEGMSDDENESDEDQCVEEDPVLQFVNIPFEGGVNRIRVNSNTKEAAAWSDSRKVFVYNIEEQLKSLSSGGVKKVPSLANRPIFSYNGHSDEGYALNWHPSQESTNCLVTGDCKGSIHMWQRGSGTSEFSVSRFYKQPQDKKGNSIEELVWSPSEQTVFAAGDTSGHICIFDTRAPSKVMLSTRISNTDVNVLAWNDHVSNLLASGCDDGEMCVWDLRKFAGKEAPSPLARFTYSNTPITSLEWHPSDESMLCVTDDIATYLYDLSIEDDDVAKLSNESSVPPQLLFLHCGSEMVKEAHWHKQIPSCVMTTSLTGLSVFIPSNL